MFFPRPMAQYWLRDQARHVSGWDMIEFGIQPSVASFKFFVHLSSDRIWKVHLAGLPGPQTLPWGAQWQGVRCGCVCVRACVRACVYVCVCACVRVYLLFFSHVISWLFSVRQAIGSLAGNSMHVRALAAGFCAIFEAAKKIKKQCFTWQRGQKEFERRWRCHHLIYNVARPSTSTSSQILLDAPRKRNSASPGLSLALLFKSWNHTLRTRHEPVQMTRLIHLDWAEACGFSLLAFLACFIMFFQHSTTMHSVFEPLSECPIHSFDEHQIEINTILFPCTHGSNFPDTSPVSQDSAVLRLTSKAGTASWRKGSRTRFLTRRERLTGRTRRPGTWSGNRSWGCQPQLERCFQGMNWLMLGTLFLKVVLV